jgi:acyl-CoA thioester hydrolase
MSRINIELPEKILGVFDIPVRISDINYGNHLGNDALVSILHEARVQWLRSLNFTELNVGGAGLIMSDLAVQFKAEVFYGDIISVTILADTPSLVGFDLYYSMRNRQHILVAQAKTGMVCFDYEKKKVVAIPMPFKTILLA